MFRKTKINDSRTIVVFHTDKHGGHKLALLNPTTTLDDGRKPGLGRTQEYLWTHYIADIEGVIKLANGNRIILLDGGDITQGNKHNDSLITTCKADQITIAEDVLAPWFAHKNVTNYLLNSGTSAHNFNEDTAEYLLINRLQARKIAAQLVPHGVLNVGGLKIDFAHHGTATGSRKWLKGGSLRGYLQSMIIRELGRGNDPPRLVFRAHRHEYVSARATHLIESDTPTEIIVDGYVCPSYCGLGDFGRQVTGSEYLLHNGLLAAEIIDGRLVEVHKFLHCKDLREEISI